MNETEVDGTVSLPHSEGLPPGVVFERPRRSLFSRRVREPKVVGASRVEGKRVRERVALVVGAWVHFVLAVVWLFLAAWLFGVGQGSGVAGFFIAGVGYAGVGFVLLGVVRERGAFDELEAAAGEALRVADGVVVEYNGLVGRFDALFAEHEELLRVLSEAQEASVVASSVVKPGKRGRKKKRVEVAS